MRGFGASGSEGPSPTNPLHCPFPPVQWLIELPVAGLFLDFCGVPGADYGSRSAQLIERFGFPKVGGGGAVAHQSSGRP